MHHCVIKVFRTEAYSEPSQTSKRELFGNRVNRFQPLTIFAEAPS